jgi:hypothetical protein
MNIGGLYTYRDSRRLHKTKELDEWFLEVDEDTPLVLLEVHNLSASLSGAVKSYKILTANGEIGWISGIQDFFYELTGEP